MDMTPPPLRSLSESDAGGYLFALLVAPNKEVVDRLLEMVAGSFAPGMYMDWLKDAADRRFVELTVMEARQRPVPMVL
jgi:hypothetical protein